MPLDAAFGGALEGHVHQLYLENLAEFGEEGVAPCADVVRQGGNGFLIVAFNGAGFGVYQGHQLVLPVHHQGFFYLRMPSQDLLHFFRVNVLAGRAQDERFNAAADEQVAGLVHNAQVSGAEPAVCCVCLFFRLRVLVIAREQIGTLGLDFSGDAVRLRGVDPDLMDGLAAGAGGIACRHVKGQQRAGFRHAIAHHIGQFNLFKDAFYLPAKRGTANDEGVHVPAQGGQQFFAYGTIEGGTDPRNGENGLGRTGV